MRPGVKSHNDAKIIVEKLLFIAINHIGLCV